MSRGLLVVVLALVALPAAPARAADLPLDRPITSTRVTDSLAIAADFWGDWPACAVRVYSATPAQLAAATGAPSAVAATQLEPGSADCPIWVSDELAANSVENRIEFCTDLGHEIGHRLGYLDDRSPLSLMNGINDSILYGCYRRFLPRGMGAWWRDFNGVPEWAVRP